MWAGPTVGPVTREMAGQTVVLATSRRAAPVKVALSLTVPEGVVVQRVVAIAYKPGTLIGYKQGAVTGGPDVVASTTLSGGRSAELTFTPTMAGGIARSCS
jgi:hypothetical protein